MSEQPIIEPEFLFIENENTNILEVTDSPPGPQGEQGEKGDAATITVGTTATVNYGTPSNVVNAGTTSAAVLNFTLSSGPVGPVGPKGDKGDTAAASYVHQQNTPAATWNIQHNLDFFPAVTVVDSGGNDVVGSISYTNRDNLVVTFGVPFGGKAYLS
jgi:hypothetical protein